MKNPVRFYLRDIYLRLNGRFSHFTPGIFILNSHFVSLSGTPNYELFCDFLKFLNKNCELVRIEESISLIKRNYRPADCIVSFTYDDGFKECYSIIAPALEEFKINAAFFICGGYVNANPATRKLFNNKILEVKNKTPMNWSEIKSLNDRGHIIGSHTLDHINMNTSDLMSVEFQINENKRLIETFTSNRCEYFAFPFGTFNHINNETLTIAEKYHKYLFSGTDYRNYFSFNGKVFNRRHIESDWPKSHIKYFLSKNRYY